MSIYKTIALVSIGYILKDRANNTVKHYNDPNSLRGHITQIINDKLDLIFYGSCEWRPAMKRFDHAHNGYMSRPNRYYPVSAIEVDDIEFDSEDEATNVFLKMISTIDKYGSVSVTDYYEYSGIADESYETIRYGWKDLSSARIYRTHDDFYAINLPEPERLN